MTMIIVKLTDASGRTYGGTQWGKGVRHEVAEWTGVLCSGGVIHAYDGACERDALALALMMHPAHARFQSPRAWLAVGEEPRVTDGMKSGYRALTTVREIPVPDVALERRVEAAIRVAWEVCADSRWRTWAAAWLDGSDRSASAAEAEAEAAWAAAETPEATAVRAAASASAWAAADAAWAAATAVDAAWAAAWAAKAAPDLAIAAIVGPVLLPDYEEGD